MLFSPWFGSALKRNRPGRRLGIEVLEDRSVPAAGLAASLVADILPGAVSSDPRDFANVNGALYFSATDPTGNLGAYRSDGTAAGTALLKSVGPLGAAAQHYTALGSNVYFSAYGHLWKTNGTPAGTTQVNIGSYLGVAGGMIAMNGKLYFSGDGPNGVELYVTDGTGSKKGTSLVKDINPTTTYHPRAGRGEPAYYSPNASLPDGFVSLNNLLLFTAEDGFHGRDLWRSDGTSEGTTLVKDLPGKPEFITIMGSAVYFGAAGSLWKSDGTTAGTTLVRSISTLSNGGITNLTVVSGKLYFAATDPVTGSGLWTSDGTSAGTVQVANVSATNLVDVAGKLYFAGSDAAGGSELWASDGASAGTVRVKDINPGGGSSSPGNLTNVNGLLYFAADDGANGRELWQSDGTAAGTVMVHDIYPGAASSDPAYLVGMDNKLYFAATDPDHGRELWDPPAVVPASEYLVVADFEGDQVQRYDGLSGDFVDTIVPRNVGGMYQPWGVLFGPDGNGDGHNDLYVSTGEFTGSGQLKAVLRYDGLTGAFIDVFTKGGDLLSVRGIIFGPDGNLYVGDFDHSYGGRVVRFDGQTGQFIDDFVSGGSGGLRGVRGIVFGPSGRSGHSLDLYATSGIGNSVLRYDGVTGAFVDVFVAAGTGGLASPTGLTFGPDGNLYVTANPPENLSVLRFQGPSGPLPGAFIDAFVPPGSGGLQVPLGAIFGPDANSDGELDLYVSDGRYDGNSLVGKKGTVKRYDGVTGSYLDTFVGQRSGGLRRPSMLTFTRTDPVTLAYLGDQSSQHDAALLSIVAEWEQSARHPKRRR